MRDGIRPSRSRQGIARTSVVVLVAAIAAACGSPSPAPSGTPLPTIARPQPQETSNRVSGWRSDLERLLPAMEALHPNLYHGTPKPLFEGDIRELASRVPSLNDDEVMTGLLRIVALVSAAGRDGHTGAFVWGEGSYPVHSLPLRLWLFSDGLFVIDALPPYRSLIGSRIDAIGGRPTRAVLRAIDPIVPRDNPWTVTLLDPRFLLIPEILHGLGLVDAPGAISLRIHRHDGEHTATVDPVTMSAYNAWAGAYGLHLVPRPGPIYLSRTTEPLWFTFLRSSSTLYIAYNRVDFLPPSLLERLRRAIARPDVARTVLDIRQNYGGEVGAVGPVLQRLRTQPAAGRPLYVITDRNTFSAAALFAAELERMTRAVFVGEPMGGSPDLYGDTSGITLPFSGIVVEVSTEYHVGGTPDDPRLTITPDIPTELSSSDYFAGRDPALTAILARPAG